jgi:hypothetical protein
MSIRFISFFHDFKKYSLPIFHEIKKLSTAKIHDFKEKAKETRHIFPLIVSDYHFSHIDLPTLQPQHFRTAIKIIPLFRRYLYMRGDVDAPIPR